MRHTIRPAETSTNGPRRETFPPLCVSGYYAVRPKQPKKRRGSR